MRNTRWGWLLAPACTRLHACPHHVQLHTHTTPNTQKGSIISPMKTAHSLSLRSAFLARHMAAAGLNAGQITRGVNKQECLMCVDDRCECKPPNWSTSSTGLLDQHASRKARSHADKDACLETRPVSFHTYRFWEGDAGDSPVEEAYANDMQSIQCHGIPDAHMWWQLLLETIQSSFVIIS